MASSSVSQDDIDNDFEKNSRRSRIRTARARAHLRLESGGERSSTACSSSMCPTVVDNVPPLESINIDRAVGDNIHELADCSSSLIGLSAGAVDSIDGADRGIGHTHPGGALASSSGDVGLLAGRGMGMLHLRGIGANNLDRDAGGSSQRNSCITDRVVSSDRTGTQAVFIPSGVSGCISGIPEGHETSPKPGVLRTAKDKSSVRNKLHHVNKGTYVKYSAG